MQSMCERCQEEKGIALKSVMNEDAICSDCFMEEIKHPRYSEAKDMEILESWKGNYNYPGLFAGQKYPFEERADVPKDILLYKSKSTKVKSSISSKQRVYSNTGISRFASIGKNFEPKS